MKISLQDVVEVPLKELSPGDTFHYMKSVYIKTNSGESTFSHVTNLKCGTLITMSEDVKVFPFALAVVADK